MCKYWCRHMVMVVTKKLTGTHTHTHLQTYDHKGANVVMPDREGRPEEVTLAA